MIEPIYSWDDKFSVNREIQIPPPSLFIPIGYDRDTLLLVNPYGDGSKSRSSSKASKSHHSVKQGEIEEEEEKKSGKGSDKDDDVKSEKTNNTASTAGSSKK